MITFISDNDIVHLKDFTDYCLSDDAPAGWFELLTERNTLFIKEYIKFTWQKIQSSNVDKGGAKMSIEVYEKFYDEHKLGETSQYADYSKKDLVVEAEYLDSALHTILEYMDNGGTEFIRKFLMLSMIVEYEYKIKLIKRQERYKID